MPRSILFLNGGRFINDDADANTHVVVGRLNPDAYQPAGYTLSLKELEALKPEDREEKKEARRVFERDSVAGKFKSRALRWTTSEEAAAAELAKFEAVKEGEFPKWADLRVVPVSKTIDHAG